MASSRQVPLVVLLLGGLIGGLGGAAALGAPDAEQTVRAAEATPAPNRRAPSTTATPRPTATTPAPGSLAAYALAADQVCARAFASVKPVDLDRQTAASMLTDLVTSSALEVRTASNLLALSRPRDAKAARVPAVLTAHRAAYAAVGAAARADGRRDLISRNNAVALAQPRTRRTSQASGAVFLALGSQRCAEWLNPAALQDQGAN